MTIRRIPCTDCAAEKVRLEAAGFVVDSCEPDGTDGMCIVAFHDPADADAPRAARMVGRLAAQPPSPPWDFRVPVAATAVVKRIEGFFAHPYDDNGAQPGGTWTIGYGTIVDAADKPVTPQTPPITEAQAEALLRRDMEGAANDVRIRVKVPLLMCEAAALISWTYNLGGGNLGKSTMLARINANQKQDVPDEMRKWINQEGRPLVGLLRRRWAEAAIFVGMDQTNACVRAWREIDSLDDWPAL
jgi:lysozyme